MGKFNFPSLVDETIKMPGKIVGGLPNNKPNSVPGRHRKHGRNAPKRGRPPNAELDKPRVYYERKDLIKAEKPIRKTINTKEIREFFGSKLMFKKLEGFGSSTIYFDPHYVSHDCSALYWLNTL